MQEFISTIQPYLILLGTAFFINIPFGSIREVQPKFSFKWFFWIHASIPLIIYLRISFGTSPWFIPLTIYLAVLGQLAGSRWHRDQMKVDEKDKFNQVPQLNKAPNRTHEDGDVQVLLLNMGGPKTNEDVKEFQKRLFEDPLLIRFPLSFIFQNFFAWLLIALRIKITEERYQLIGGGSPIYSSTEAQVTALREEMRRRGRNIDIDYSFNYSPPYPDETIKDLIKKNKKAVLPLSLYPHYSKATTGSNLHYLKSEADKQYPQLQFIDSHPYYLHEGYIQAFADRIYEQMGLHDSLDDFYLIFSAHGLPLYFLNEGDPYPFQISQTIARILEKINRDKDWVIAYQSAVGPMQWLKPSTDNMIDALAREGYKKVLIVPVSFVGDHIETICEIDMEYRVQAEKIGISDFRMAKAIECHPGFINALADSIEMSLPNNNSTLVPNEKREELSNVSH